MNWLVPINAIFVYFNYKWANECAERKDKFGFGVNLLGVILNAAAVAVFVFGNI